VALLDFDALADEQRVAVPADAVRPAGQFDGFIVAVFSEHVRRDRARARAEPAIGFLQRDDIGVEFAEHRQHAAGVAAAIEPYAFAHIVGGDLDHDLFFKRSGGASVPDRFEFGH